MNLRRGILLLSLGILACSSNTTTGSDAGSRTDSGESPTDSGPGAIDSGSRADGGSAETNADRAVAALRIVFQDHDESAVPRYWGNYVAHNPHSMANGTGFLTYAASDASFEGVSLTAHRVLVEGDLAVVHSTYHDFPGWPAEAVVFDMMRFDPTTHLIMEHWDCMQGDPGTYVSGHTMVDGSTELDASATAAASRMRITEPGGLYPTLLAGDFSRLGEFFDANYVQHNPLIDDGLAGFYAAGMAAPFNTVRIVALRQSIADHDFVFARALYTMTQSADGSTPNQPTVFCDLFRLAGGRVVEHWDVIQPIPDATDASALPMNGAGNTMF